MFCTISSPAVAR